MSVNESPAPTHHDIRCVAISIATFRRPQLLSQLLNVCAAQTAEVDARVRIVVVDNDPLASAREAVAFFPGVEYIHEPLPGIAAARNRGLDATTEDDDAIIFIDDDEVPAPGWLREMLAYAVEHRADIVTGPVEPIITDSIPRWIVRGGFWRRQNGLSGSTPGSVATNNTLLRLAAWRANPTRFSEALSMKGGSDTEFFRSLRAASPLKVLWCAEAVVSEHVIPERANAKWLFRRAIRIGNINARYRTRAAAFMGGIARIGVGLPFIAFDFAVHRQPMARSWNMLAHGLGMVGNVLNVDLVEYRRKTNGA
ncbi:glycosyltransferase [Microbacterium sp. NPDC089180]|uniref:glycosyltransferase family 2 protein n=1 Tax=unclassified Microbacterium TaxID=2609290 RepID=UPI00344048C2